MIADGIRQFVEEVAPTDAAGQVLRVARRFALVAVAGELATHYELTGWREGEATDAAQKCFAVWLDTFGGTGNREECNILAQVRAFFETHGASRFEDMSDTSGQRVISRAGFYRIGDSGEREYLVLQEAFKRDVCQGFDVKTSIPESLAWFRRELAVIERSQLAQAVQAAPAAAGNYEDRASAKAARAALHQPIGKGVHD